MVRSPTTRACPAEGRARGGLHGYQANLGALVEECAEVGRHASLDRSLIQPYGCIVQVAPPDFDRVFGALADHTRRDIVRRAIDANEGILELASHP